MQVFTDDDLRVLIPLITEAIRQAITDAGVAADAKVKVVSDRLDKIMNGSVSDAIDTIEEMEAFLRGLSDSETLTGLLQQLRTTIETKMTEQLATKVDKVEGKALSTNDYTDTDRATVEAVADERKQFNIFGYYHSLDGTLHTESDAYFNSGKVVINREHPIEVYGMGTTHIAAIAFYSASGTFIKSHAYPDFKASKIVCAAENIPSGAAYFMASSIPGKPYYWQNGPTREARENATADAIASLKAWRCNQYHVRGYVFVETGVGVGNNHVFVDEISLTTPRIPINRSYPIVNYTSGHNNNASTIALYDANGGLIGAVNRRINNSLPGALLDYADDSGLTFGTTTVPVDAIPPHAVYFRCGAMRENVARSWYSNGPTQEAREGAVSEAIISSKELAFIDLWVAAWGNFGGYDSTATDGHPYLGNGLRMTYEEALKIYEYRWTPPHHIPLDGAGIRTNLLVQSTLGEYDAHPDMSRRVRDSKITVLRMSCTDTYGCVVDNDLPIIIRAPELTEVLGTINLMRLSTSFTPVQSAPKLRRLFMQDLVGSLDLSMLPLLSFDSLLYTVGHARHTGSQRSITLHPDTFNKTLPGDDIEAPGTGSTDWTGYTPNLLKSSDTVHDTVSYETASYTIMDQYVPAQGDQLTVTIWGKLGEGKGEFGAYTDGGWVPFVHLTEIADGVYSASGTWNTTNSGHTADGKLHIFALSQLPDNIASRIDRIKLELGKNDNPVWTPCSDDIDDDELRERVKWRELPLLAAGRNIQLATTE